ncbi:hypothetical protein SERLA73DRAFT_180411 [Serpula lacrymans var. lacrymans S7.3]|uniref:Uncharacterized protein n=1 Tax=Serpula lacrymans var. lacrymans (strain S7.3) TaxID=936435 RepID=F8PUJ9_SERL3|nr:hypothetical protein SERLA73DRAFT_180411 [Serpula lacrymans var. lacrymans S7.3]
MFFASALLIAGAGLASAQSLSSQCQTTLTQLATSSDASCLNPLGLAALVTSNSSSTSIIPTLSSWLTTTCSSAACTNQSLSNIVSNVTSGCASDLQSIGASTTDTSGLISAVQQYYPTVRQVACLQDTSANENCAIETLYAIQNSTTTLSLTNIAGLISKVMSGQSSGIPSNISCTSCAKAAYVTIQQSMPALISSSVSSDAQQQCGANFTTGGMPSNIKETASNSTSTTTTSAATTLSVGGYSMGAAVSALIAISSVFTFLA